MTFYNVIDNTYATSGLPFLNDGDTVIQLQNTLITGGGSAAMQSSSDASITLVLDGMITGSRGVDVGARSRISIGETGHIASYNISAISLTGSGTITNHGLVEHISGGTSINLTGSVNSDSVRFTNSGSVEGQIRASLFSVGDQLTLTNTGTIIANGSVLDLNDEIDLITNFGTIIGTVTLGGGADIFDTQFGTFSGSVDAGAGGDKLYGSTVSDTFKGGADSDALYGYGGDDKLSGDDGADALNGGLGADTLSGGTGSDRALYTSATSGVIASLLASSINAGEARGDTYISIENLTGSSFDDALYGNAVANAINGGAGNDIIKGYAGSDTLTGSVGNDTFIFDTALNAATNLDTITDFNVADDTLQLQNAVFTALTATGVLSATAFVKNAAGVAADASDRIIYETDTGNVFYDQDGNGSAFAGIQFAKLTAGLAITNADFFVI